MRTRRLIAAALAVASAAVIGTVVLPATTSASPRTPAGNGGGLCTSYNPVTKKCLIHFPIPGEPGDHGGNGGNGGGGDNGPFTGCRWEPYAGRGYTDPPRPGDQPPEAVYSIYICYKDGIQLYCPCITRWITPGTVATVTPDQVARSIDVEALLHAPHLVLYPPGGKPSLVKAPVFVAVDNWQGDVTGNGCLAGVCVDILARPTLTFTPGDGAATITCRAGGTHFDRNGADPNVQAQAPGACAHIYTKRTGVHGRPTAWHAAVTITWVVTWQAVGPGGQVGALPDVVQTTPFAQAVGELQGVVNKAG